MQNIINKIKNNKKLFIIIASAIILIIIISVVFWNINKKSKDNTLSYMSNKLDETKIDVSTGAVKEDYVISWLPIKGIVTLEMKTNKGDITMELDADKAPITVMNFVYLSKAGYYNNTKFHRVIENFMIQGGDFNSQFEDRQSFWGTGNPGYYFADEFSPNDNMVYGDVAMANSGPDTNGSQFFIVTAEATPALNGKHTIFGKVIKGMDVVMSIQSSKTDASDRPIDPIIINQVTVEE